MGRNTHTQLMECQAELAREREARERVLADVKAELGRVVASTVPLTPRQAEWLLGRVRDLAGDEDYAPVYQDEYQRLWHVAGEQVRLLTEQAEEWDDLLAAERTRADMAEGRVRDLQEALRKIASWTEAAHTTAEVRDFAREALVGLPE